MARQKVAPLSYTDTYGWYGLRINPSFDQVVGKVAGKKPLGIPVPDRSSKWYALGPYRAYLLDAQRKYNDFEKRKLDYGNSGATLPVDVAAHSRPSDSESDGFFERQSNYNDTLDAYELGLDAQAIENVQLRRQTAELRRQQLSSAGPNLMHPVIEAHHEELVDASVPHAVPAPRVPMIPARWPTPHQDFAAAGIPQGPQFPTFEELNLNQRLPTRSLLRVPSQASTDGGNVSYEQMRRQAFGR